MLTVPGPWIREATSASAPIYQGPVNQNPEFFDVLAPRLQALPPGVIVDVGANMGAYTLNIRSRCSGPIVAFEPDPFMFKLLNENIRFNALENVSTHNLACGDSEGALRFRTGINGNVLADGSATGDDVITVPVVRLDEELKPLGPVSLLKIDCEGFEWHILKGCLETLQTHKPLLFIELHPKLIGRFGHSIEEVCGLLKETHNLEFWDINPSQRSSNRVRRFVARYRREARRLRDEKELMATARAEDGPDQLFMLAVPKRSA